MIMEDFFPVFMPSVEASYRLLLETGYDVTARILIQQLYSELCWNQQERRIQSQVSTGLAAIRRKGKGVDRKKM